MLVATRVAMKQFFDIFKATNMNANLVKCLRWYKRKAQIMKSFKIDNFSLSHAYVRTRKHIELKCVLGRGRKTKQWIDWLYYIVRADFG